MSPQEPEWTQQCGGGVVNQGFSWGRCCQPALGPWFHTQAAATGQPDQLYPLLEPGDGLFANWLCPWVPQN